MDDVVQGRVRRAGWSAVTRGGHVEGADPDLAQQLRAWSLVLPDTAVFTHLTAAELRGWWLPERVPHPVLAAVDERHRHPQRRGLTALRLVGTGVAHVVEGVRLATPAETLLTCAADLDVLDLVPMADSALRLGHCTMADLVASGCCTSPPRSRSSRSTRSGRAGERPSREPTSGWSARGASTSTTAPTTVTRRPTARTSPANGGWWTSGGNGAPTPRARSSAVAETSSPPLTRHCAGRGTPLGSRPGESWCPARCTAPPSAAARSRWAATNR
ncbi:MAG: hypothetical protein ACRYG2_33895, partial [Janthinobacterium lividum]